MYREWNELQQQTLNICRTLNELSASSIGPLGKIHMVKRGLGSNADFDFVCSSELMMDQLAFEHPIAKILSQALRSHNRAYHDHGYSFLFYCTRLVMDLLNLKHNISPQYQSFYALDNTVIQERPAFSSLEVEVCFRNILSWIDDFFNNRMMKRRQLNINDFVSLSQFLSSMFASNQLVNMKENERQILSIQLVKAFYHSLSKVTSSNPKRLTNNSIVANIRLSTIVSSSADLTQTKIVDGALLDMTMPIEVRHVTQTTEICDCKVVLYDIILDLDAVDKFPKQNEIQLISDTISSIPTTEESLDKTGLDFYQTFAKKLQEMNVGIVASQKTIHSYVKTILIRYGIIPLERLSLRHIQLFKETTQAAILNELSATITDQSLGFIGRMKEIQISGRSCILIEGKKGDDILPVTLILQTNFSHKVADLERLCRKALSVLSSAVTSQDVVPGGGIAEILMADYLSHRTEVYCREERISNSMKAKMKQITRIVKEILYDYAHNLVVKEKTREAEIDREELVHSLLQYNQPLSEQLKSEDTLKVTYNAFRWDYRQKRIVNQTLEESDGVWDLSHAKKEALQSAIEQAIMIVNIDCQLASV